MCCLVFLSESVMRTHLGYFLMNGTTLHLRVEVRCMHHTEHDWLELWKANDYLLSECWTNAYLCMITVFANVFLLIMLIWFCVDLFYNKLSLIIFVLCDWYLWWSWTIVHGNKWATIDYMEKDYFVGAAKPTWWCWDYFGRELCFGNWLLRSWFYNSFELRMQITNLIICMN